MNLNLKLLLKTFNQINLIKNTNQTLYNYFDCNDNINVINNDDNNVEESGKSSKQYNTYYCYTY
ncbi:hypothetical protein DERP_003069 [Dermatophagoides pteronyssinus]|uniref:Uncharacterized protein n=1 Tax=Dermatophagoides pteronyssinus TaxID=6956 RepID=A0ABQ8JIF8_DERPT|nr:hypothetical protein DERP_003069 [Dermatophagoides pteronyssinus]